MVFLYEINLFNIDGIDYHEAGMLEDRNKGTWNGGIIE
jgi:hypothetical protein